MDSLGIPSTPQHPGRSSVESGPGASEVSNLVMSRTRAVPCASTTLRSSSPLTHPAEPHLTVVPPLRPRRNWYERWGKRAFDLAVSSTILFLVAPVMLLVWLVLRITLGQDVVITQDRVGLGGSTFGMYKFRTMHWSRRGRSLPYDGPDRRVVHKTDNDPRHTPVGRAFRKASLDELPQLMNVLVGDMSLVGPRPELAEIVDRIDARGHQRHSLRPGMTGEWQITGRQDGRLLHECFDDDLPYLGRVTLRNDLAILLRTVGVVTGRGGR